MEIEHFPTGNRRKQIIEENAAAIKEFEGQGLKKIEEGYYPWLDSPLDGDWQANDGNLYSTFRFILPKGIKLGQYIEEILSEKKGKAIGIEFGGTGIKLFQGFSPGFFQKTIGVTLVDHSGEAAKGIQKHTVLEEDILSPTIREKLDDTLKDAKVDLIIERMGKGLEFVPNEPFMVSKVLQDWYSLLREGGIMFVQTPVAFNELLEAWATMIERDYSEVLELKKHIHLGGDSKFSLRKLKGAPTKLPMLNPKTVRHTEKSERIIHL